MANVGLPNADLPRKKFLNFSGGSDLGDAEWLIDADFFSVASEPPATGTQIKAFNGSSWITGTLKRWTGTEWKAETLQQWNGTAWVTV